MKTNLNTWIISLLFLTLITGYSTAKGTSEDMMTEPAPQSAEMEKTEHVDADEFQNYISKGNHLLLDVRTDGEYRDGHIADSLLIPVQELEERLTEIEEWKDQTVLVYCRSGNRSRSASDILEEAGFMNIINLDTGVRGWSASGRELVTE